MNYEEQRKNYGALVRICPMEWRRLTGAEETRRSSRFSGQIRVMQRPELVTMRRPAAAAAAELGQGSSSARKKTKEREVAEGPSGRPIYKGELISGREKQGDHGVVISP